jgi:hypothetical protein
VTDARETTEAWISTTKKADALLRIAWARHSSQTSAQLGQAPVGCCEGGPFAVGSLFGGPPTGRL